jgi:hypothetical protein
MRWAVYEYGVENGVEDGDPKVPRVPGTDTGATQIAGGALIADCT